jgi:choline dehydrogenase-like flavoprotein
MGTTKMSTRASNGVVDPNCRVHGVPNLFIAGSSVFPTGGFANPTLSLVALAIRLAHHLGRGSRTDEPAPQMGHDASRIQ